MEGCGLKRHNQGQRGGAQVRMAWEWVREAGSDWVGQSPGDHIKDLKATNVKPMKQKNDPVCPGMDSLSMEGVPEKPLWETAAVKAKDDSSLKKSEGSRDGESEQI